MGAVQSPWMPAKGQVSMRVRGRAPTGGRGTFPDHRQSPTRARAKAGEWKWTTSRGGTARRWDYLELITKFDKPALAGRTSRRQRSFFGITDAFYSENGGAPKEDLSPLQRLFAARNSTPWTEAAARDAAGHQARR